MGQEGEGACGAWANRPVASWVAWAAAAELSVGSRRRVARGAPAFTEWPSEVVSTPLCSG